MYALFTVCGDLKAAVTFLWILGRPRDFVICWTWNWSTYIHFVLGKSTFAAYSSL